jgi:hypothetical protein
MDSAPGRPCSVGRHASRRRCRQNLPSADGRVRGRVQRGPRFAQWKTFCTQFSLRHGPLIHGWPGRPPTGALVRLSGGSAAVRLGPGCATQKWKLRVRGSVRAHACRIDTHVDAGESIGADGTSTRLSTRHAWGRALQGCAYTYAYMSHTPEPMPQWPNWTGRGRMKKRLQPGLLGVEAQVHRMRNRGSRIKTSSGSRINKERIYGS